jgi:hypothetical protein
LHQHNFAGKLNYIGLDIAGRTKEGRHWRFVGSEGAEIQYSNVSKEAAQYFDNIVDAMCVKQ